MRLGNEMIAHGRNDCRTFGELLRSATGLGMNGKRIERIWRQAGLKVCQGQPKPGPLWLNDGPFIRVCAE